MAKYATTELMMTCVWGCRREIAIDQLIKKTPDEHRYRTVDVSICCCPACGADVLLYNEDIDGYALFGGDEINLLPEELWMINRGEVLQI